MVSDVRQSDGCPDLEFTLKGGEHALHAEGDLRAGRRWFESAYRAAELGGDGEGLARAALGLGGVWVHEHRTAAEAAAVRARQKRALAAVEPGSPLALRLRARLCAEEDYRTGRHTAILHVLAQARLAGDMVAVAEALSLAHHCLLGPAYGPLRLELAEELIGQASHTGRHGDLVMGLVWRTVDLFLAGEPHATRSLAELRGTLKRREHLAGSFVVRAIDVMLAIRAGRLAEAEELALECAESGAAAGDIDATIWYGAQILTIRWFQGRLGELVPALTELVNSPDLSTLDYSYTAALAMAAAGTGNRRLASGLLARLRGGDLPSSSILLVSLYGMAETACEIEDAGTAAQLYERLLPYAKLPMIVSLGATCFGSAQHALGVAALTTGAVDLAIQHFRAAVRDNLALGHWPAAVLSRWRLAQALARRHGPGDESARRERAQAEDEAAELAMALPAESTPRAHVERRGRQWHVELGGRVALVDHSVGMGYLATLLANPGREIRAADLAGGSEDGVTNQPLLDGQAERTYKERLNELESDIEELEAMYDTERATALRAERDWLIAELAAATGLGGRVRSFTGSDERARIAVGKAIRRALARIAEADPVIGAELKAGVHTGLRCSYRPR
ncbi:hypothetical protein [Nonomuraea sp. NPDC050310]|uniref:hypothetical protein n=1 Tax=Nonomuraea sp. NPDC050310 TaxID=3154935 RepID=UPI0033E462DC